MIVNKLLLKEWKSLFFGKKHLPKILVEILARYGDGYTWIVTTAYKMNDYYLIPKSPLGILRIPLPPRKSVDRVWGYSGMVRLFMPDRDLFYPMKSTRPSEDKKKIEITLEDGTKKQIDIPVAFYFKPEMKKEKDFFEIVSKETGMRTIWIEVNKDLKAETDVLKTWIEKIAPVATMAIILIVSAVAIVVVTGNATKAITHAQGVFDKFVTGLGHVLKNAPPPTQNAGNMTNW